jgi:hypothetical protein
VFTVWVDAAAWVLGSGQGRGQDVLLLFDRILRAVSKRFFL